MSKLTNATDKVNEAQHLTELLRLAADGTTSNEGNAFGFGAIVILDRLNDAARILNVLCEKRIAKKHTASPLPAMAAEYRKVRDAFNSLPPDQEGREEYHRLDGEIDLTRDAIFAYGPANMDEVAEKSTILLEIWDQAESLNPKRIRQMLQAFGGRRDGPCAS